MDVTSSSSSIDLSILCLGSKRTHVFHTRHREWYQSICSVFMFLLFLLCGGGLLFSQPEVDIVYTWVDGDDPEWIKVRNTWAKKEGKSQIGADSHHDARFRDNQELKYSLRSLHKFVPFIRRIFIVTCGQRPKWLKDHPQITVVSHEEFFKNKEHLPTFNSHAIESNLHRISGLSEHYVYMNDDFFYGRPITFEDFYSKKGDKIKLYFSRHQRMKPEKPSSKDSGYRAANKNTALLLRKKYGKAKRYTHTHTPYPQIKSLVYAIEGQYPQIFELDSSHRFRSLNDYTMTNGLIPYVSYYMGRAELGKATYETVNYGRDYKRDKEKLKSILAKPRSFFCLNDTPGMNDIRSLRMVEAFLQSYFPDPAPWEEVEDSGVIIQEKGHTSDKSKKERLKLFKKAVYRIEREYAAQKKRRGSGHK